MLLQNAILSNDATKRLYAYWHLNKNDFIKTGEFNKYSHFYPDSKILGVGIAAKDVRDLYKKTPDPCVILYYLVKLPRHNPIIRMDFETIYRDTTEKHGGDRALYDFLMTVKGGIAPTEITKLTILNAQ